MSNGLVQLEALVTPVLLPSPHTGYAKLYFEPCREIPCRPTTEEEDDQDMGGSNHDDENDDVDDSDSNEDDKNQKPGKKGNKKDGDNQIVEKGQITDVNKGKSAFADTGYQQ